MKNAPREEFAALVTSVNISRIDGPLRTQYEELDRELQLEILELTKETESLALQLESRDHSEREIQRT